MAKEKIAVLGGGCAAMAAVFALTDRKDWRQKYEITVYQPGWRLGGKGASGRNARAGERIQEHGLHVWSGFYENAFWLMRKCYAELNRPTTHPLATAFAAFQPHHYAGLSRRVEGEWFYWKGYLPHDTGLPGDFIDPASGEPKAGVRSPWEMMSELILWATQYLQTTSNTAKVRAPDLTEEKNWLIRTFIWGRQRKARNWLERIAQWIENIVVLIASYRVLLAFRAASRYHDRADLRPQSRKVHLHTDAPYQRLARRLECLQRWSGMKLRGLATAQSDEQSFYVMIDLAMAMMIGMLKDGVIAHGFDVIDDKDLREWLRFHGAHPTSVGSSTVGSAYSYLFSFEDGEPLNPDKQRLAAGVALRLMMRLLLCSRGGSFWKMRAGMGDVVFAPIYEVLKKRGVNFRFFHRVLEIKTDDGKQVDEILIGRQADLKNGEPGYAPLKDIKGIPCWPAEPDYDQLVQGDELRQKYRDTPCDLDSGYTDWPDVAKFTLKRGEHFDRVVLGISIGALDPMCRTLLAHSVPLDEAVKHIKTVRTQSVQLWMNPDLRGLGWWLPPAIITSYGEPFDTWADMSELLEREAWSDDDFPKSIGYFCGVMKDDADGIKPPSPQPGLEAAAEQQVRRNAAEWFAQFTGELWPDATRDRTTALDYNLLYRPGGGTPDERFEYQWFRANIDPSSRYVLALPGTTRYRLHAHESGFDNLVLAGDWLHTGLNYGCVESAVIGGLQAARAICKYPSLIYGENDFPADSPFIKAAGEEAAVKPAAVAGAVQMIADTYVRRGGMDVLPAPWRCDDVQMYAFYVPCNLAALQKICDRSLNEPSHGFLNYRPTTRYAVLTFQRLNGLYSTAPGHEGRGAHSYCEAALWVMAAHHRADGRTTDERAVLVPYIFADDGLAVATGREVYGYPKEHAIVQMPIGDQPLDAFSVRGLAVPKYRAGAKAEPAIEILSCGRAGSGVLAAAGHLAHGLGEDLWSAVRDGKIEDTPLALMRDFIELMLTGQMHLVFLRQIRALGGGAGSDLQAIVGTVYDPVKVKCLRLLKGRYELTLPSLDSHPIATDFGLALKDGRADVLMGIEIDLGFVLQPGENLWPSQVA